MPLRPDFYHWFTIIQDYKHHGLLRGRYPLRPNGCFLPSKEHWQNTLNRLDEVKENKDTPEYEVTKACLNLFGQHPSELHFITEIVFERNGQPYLILDNAQRFSNDDSVCILIDLDRLIRFGYLTKRQDEETRREQARKRLYRVVAGFGFLCLILGKN
jgi:hypothetical protein